MSGWRKAKLARARWRRSLIVGSRRLWGDTSGLMAPYVAVMLPVLVGFALLALDASRRMSLQTQLQAAADALALAGARELNKQPGAQARASAAMANAFAASKPANTIFGMGWSPTLTYSFAFYSSLSPASDGIGGGAATGDADSKFVSVTIRPQTVSTILPASFLNAFSPNSFAAGAEAVAGFAGTTVCSVAPLFICNPYEATSGSMTDAQATAALYEALASPANLRRQFKLNRGAVAPGHFGWIETADGCNDVSCMGADLASVSGACYNDSAVPLAIGNKNAFEPYLDVRFDIFT
ncbi:MAG: hypothetical protein JO312_04965, partial [Hyphomicrobiales bacterium]|nr:hypothetical protein [Hyphomicrobiales bacterium]